MHMHPDIREFLHMVAAGNTEFERLEELAEKLLEQFADPEDADKNKETEE